MKSTRTYTQTGWIRQRVTLIPCIHVYTVTIFGTHFRSIGILVHFAANEFQPEMAFHAGRRDVILMISKLLSINSGTGISSGV